MARKGIENSSVRHTKMRIREGFFLLLKEKTIREITVSELTSAIDINRGTFYYHYQDIYALVEELEDEIFTQFEGIMEHPQKRSEEIIYQIFVMICNNHEFLSIVLVSGGDIDFLEKLKQYVSAEISPLLMDVSVHESPLDYEYFNSFIISGFIGIAQKWLENGMKESPKEIACFTTSFIHSCILLFINGSADGPNPCC